ncbi:prenyltransferase [Mucilaginibacter gotjawali]|uniref:Prenyltransferase n=1 Tax=Mucilaginibacter gotjawali TaxID=1550579 RepID=A0A120MXP2_9SPHI|nr:prenyltransferase [Mucilaginibacter gotjawali]
MGYVFVFMLYLVLIINYNYLVNSFPYLKIFYVAIVTIVHLFIIFLLVPINLFFCGCIISNILSQEILLDLRDLKGDGNTLPKIVGKKITIRLVSLLQLLQLLLLIAYGKFNIMHCGLILLTVLTQVLLYFFWKQKKNELIISTLKVQTIMMFALII